MINKGHNDDNNNKNDNNIDALSIHLINYLTVDGTPGLQWDYYSWMQIPINQGLREPKYILAHTIHELTPQARIIFILRNPVDRYLTLRPYKINL